MNIGRAPLVGAYVCPRGAFTIECKRSRGSLEIVRALEVPMPLESAEAAADHLMQVLRSARIARGHVVLAIRGFGLVHHVLQMPPASDAMLGPIIDRELRRLEPQLERAVVSWTSLPPLETGAEDTPQRSLLTVGAPAELVTVFEERLKAGGLVLDHLTALPGAMERLLEEFAPGTESTALVAPLPDGAFLGFSLNAGLRLIVEPPLAQDGNHDAAAIAEEVELGVMFVRQQFRGAQIERVALVGSKDSVAAAEFSLSERLHVPVSRLGVDDLSTASFAALGAILDAQSPNPLSLGGSTRRSVAAGPLSTLQSISIAAVLLLALLGAWTITEAVRANRAANALQVARRQIERNEFGLAPLKSTADQRRRTRDAMQAMRIAANDRMELQESLAGIAAVMGGRAQIDSVRLDRGAGRWRALVAGTVGGATNAGAVQALNDLYRELPARIFADSMHLDQLAYTDSSAIEGASSVVHFRMSFGIPTRRKK